jgi:hypothetical protein
MIVALGRSQNQLEKKKKDWRKGEIKSKKKSAFLFYPFQ